MWIKLKKWESLSYNFKQGELIQTVKDNFCPVFDKPATEFKETTPLTLKPAAAATAPAAAAVAVAAVEARTIKTTIR
jgi:hypothetical protein